MNNKEVWRLLEAETPNDAAMNLAIDEAIFVNAVNEDVLPVIRFWRNKKAVIIGYSQIVKTEVNLQVCLDEDIQVVRRCSGGGTVYHDLGNLNYSIIIPHDHPLVETHDIRESYRIFCSGIIEGLREFDITPTFEDPSSLLIGDKKISGNAQSRKKGIILHHGTVLVDSDLELLRRVINFPRLKTVEEHITSKKQPVTNLSLALGYHMDMAQVKEALKRGFETAFSMKLKRYELSIEEKQKAEALYMDKYSLKEWTFRRK